ncbi:MAG: TlpA disulfide reductase family protein [Candidatus Phosphoribacter sp.]|nr:TlpA family protein disulfide reductase [Actinomycetales bacterium]
MKAAVAVAVVLAVGFATAGCSDLDSLEAQARSGNRAAYAEGDGRIEQLAPSARGAALALAGTTVDGATWSMAEQGAGKVVVVNVWGSWCPPCVVETPALQAAWASYEGSGKPVAFVGVDTMESSDTGLAFLRANGVTYPSINDSASAGAPVLALAGTAPATPTTLVLDRQGRVAARVLGGVTQITVRTLVDAVLAES